jgi:ribosomal-protein-alanine N-acetyltransferase
MNVTSGKIDGSGVTLRKMEASDLLRVLEIESSCYGSESWPPAEFIERLNNAKATILLAEKAGQIAGFVIYSRNWFKLHLENVAVCPFFRRAGIARLMVSRVIADLPAQKRRRVVLEVRKSNLAAQSCYEQLGFRKTGEIAGYYWTDREDALVMEYRC